MATLRFTFLWEEDDPMSYDEFTDQLMHLGAYDIEDEKVEQTEEAPRTARKKKP